MAIRGRQSEEQEDDSEVNLTPMLDVVFIMLIFFIVTASFVKDSGIEVQRPSAETAVPKPRGNILIAISETGEVWLQKRRIDVGEVRSNIERLLAETPEASVVVQADRKSKNGLFVRVYDQAKRAGVKEIAISALEASQ